MGFGRRLAGALVSTVAALTLLTTAPASAGALDACAERVIRDWYSGGRVDKVYPLDCYRAALRSLPSDVLQYSDADQDIRRALAFARRGRGDPGNGPGAATAPSTAEPTRAQPSPAPVPVAKTKPVADEVAAPPRKARIGRETPPVSASVPYPIIALGGLAGLLLATGVAGWLASRRR